MAITPQKIQSLATAITAFKTSVIAAFNRKLQSAQNSDNAGSLGGKTATVIVNEATAAIAQHASLANPHQVTVESLNTYTSAQINGFLADKVAQGIVPLSMLRIGEQMTTRRLDTQWQISTTDAEFLLGGRYLKVPAKVWHNIAITLENGAKYYLYLRIKLGVIHLEVNSLKLPENNYCMYVGSFFGPSSTTEADVDGFLPGVVVEKVGNYRVSPMPAGSAIPVSSNAVNQEPTLNWV